MKPFTVLLLLPDYATGDFGHETYQAWVHAETAQEAKEAGQLQAVESLCPEGEDRDPPEDYHVLAVYDGHLEDIKDQA